MVTNLKLSVSHFTKLKIYHNTQFSLYFLKNKHLERAKVKNCNYKLQFLSKIHQNNLQQISQNAIILLLAC